MRYQKVSYRRRLWRRTLPVAAGLLLIILLVITQIPGVKSRLTWRYEVAITYLRGIVQPVQALPTAMPVSAAAFEATAQFTPTASPTPTQTATITPTPVVSPTPRPTPTPLPEQVRFDPPPYEKQDINNCGPATLSMFLWYFGWKGDQFTISDLIKPIPQDRNVNIDELLFYTRNYAGWLRSEFRVGGTIEQMKALLAAGFPVIVEESFLFEEYYWPNDDRWAGHYLLLTGYDDASQIFLAQDSFYGANQRVSYTTLDEGWQTFNRVYFFAYMPDQEPLIRDILGEDWDARENRQRALDTARAETVTDPENPFAWFNLGSNLVYFERYNEAAQAYDRAREIGLPQRMLRYQFGPFFAYFNMNRNQDLLALTEYALQITPNAEEALLWRGWALYRDGKRGDAVVSFQKALEARPGYYDAIYALDFVTKN